MKLKNYVDKLGLKMSPSTRREWIEMELFDVAFVLFTSPSTRREWIEIATAIKITVFEKSPSTRREWIEIFSKSMSSHIKPVSLHAEGVD